MNEIGIDISGHRSKHVDDFRGPILRLAVIALWLGHESIETTHIYVEADLAMKERALERIVPASSSVPMSR
jgi:hypothetical protein